MNGAVRRYNRMPPATCPLDFFNPHLFDIRKPPLDPMRFFTPKLFQLPREVPVVDPAEFFVPNLFTLPRPAPNHLLDFFAPRLFRQPRPSDWLISCVADPLELFVPELFTLERLGLLPQLLMDLEALDEFIAKEKRWDEEMDAKLAELDTRFAYLDRQEKEGNKRLQKNWALSGKRLVGRRAGNQLKESNKPREGVAAWEERQKEGGGVAQEGGMEAKPKQSRDGAVAARGVKFEASRRRDRGANQGGGGRSGVGASRGQGDGSNGGQGVVASTSASGSRRALGKAMGGVGRV
ncbi:hypothetical protein FRC08_008280 [Ceratobasidium sp. 394]|nr:hypothetical protein FRC08_008280 [Ceratobasidium sp. 394]